MAINPNILVSISGDPKSGKTYLAMTFPEPIKIYSFDLGADYVRDKYFPKKAIDIHNISLPIIDTDPPPPYAEPIWNGFEAEYKRDCEGGKYKTLVIDTATALWAIVHQAITEMKNRKKILEVEYFLPNLKMSALFARARAGGLNLVVTHYLRDKYVGGENTGQTEPDGWKRAGGQVDVNLWIESVDKGDLHVMRSVIKNNRFTRVLNGRTFDDLSYMQLISVLLES